VQGKAKPGFKYSLPKHAEIAGKKYNTRGVPVLIFTINYFQ
jgi:hypothetical protein